MSIYPDRIVEVGRALQHHRHVAVVGVRRITSALAFGKWVNFCTNKRNDPIQRAHRYGKYYESEELALLERLLPKGLVYADIGANVGNHSLFFAIVMEAEKVIPFEPNELAYELLISNVLVNGLHSVVALDRLGVGVSDSEADGYSMQERRKNLGAARMLDDGGPLSTCRADSLLEGETPAFIKIDVEGMEMQVLSGLSDVIARCRPIMFIEVDNDNAEAFDAWCDGNGYVKVYSLQRYEANKNHLIVDADLEPAFAASLKELELGNE